MGAAWGRGFAECNAKDELLNAGILSKSGQWWPDSWQNTVSTTPLRANPPLSLPRISDHQHSSQFNFFCCAFLGGEHRAKTLARSRHFAARPRFGPPARQSVPSSRESTHKKTHIFITKTAHRLQSTRNLRPRGGQTSCKTRG